jgi:hypothetical protein
MLEPVTRLAWSKHAQHDDITSGSAITGIRRNAIKNCVTFDVPLSNAQNVGQARTDIDH